MPQLKIKTVSGRSFTLTPVPMPRFPSAAPEDWLVFQGLHVPGSKLSDATIRRVVAFMTKHKTEALTDGKVNYTQAGGMLAVCFPEKIV